MDNNPSDLLPVGAHALSANPGLADAVRQFGSTYGYDYFDDETVRRTLAEHEASLRRTARGVLVWAASLAGTVGIAWLVWAASSKPESIGAAVAPPAVLLVLAVAAFVRVHVQGRRKLRHPFLEGYPARPRSGARAQCARDLRARLADRPWGRGSANDPVAVVHRTDRRRCPRFRGRRTAAAQACGG